MWYNSGMSLAGYDFSNEELLAEALTTPSFRMDCPEAHDNQRLEFLGDAVLGVLAAERLYREFPGEPEGRLTVRRTHMVSTAALCAAAGRLQLAPRLRRNRAAQPLAENSKTLADAIEALIGAAYLDGGWEAAGQVFTALELEANAEVADFSVNPKGDLQIKMQAMKPPRRPEYELIATAGKAHAPIFTVRVRVEGVGEAEASAGSHKEAEARAAAALLESIPT